MRYSPLRASARYRRNLLSEADRYLVDRLREIDQTVITPYRFFRLIQDMYRSGNLRSLRSNTIPGARTHEHYFRRLSRLDMIGPDPDYESRLIQVRVVSSQPVEDIVCLADPLCHISHLSAMDRWGLTDRIPLRLTFTRPDRETSLNRLREMMESDSVDPVPDRLRLRPVRHPVKVRDRTVQVTESRDPGASATIPGGVQRLATIGQTFLDMLRRPELCGGMEHVIEVYDRHAAERSDDIIAAVDTCDRKVVKCRAGYLLEERLGIRHPRITRWKETAPQRGSSCKLDPTRDYAPTYSEAWMISLNA